MKYLGLILDSRWDFKPHFTGLALKDMGAANTVGRIMHNLEGPRDGVRRLYMGVVRSM